MSDADLTLDPLAGGLPIEPREPEPTTPDALAPEATEPFVEPTEPLVEPAEPLVEPAEPVVPPPPAMSADELAAMAATAPTPTPDELASLAAEAGAALPLGPIVVEPAPTDAVPAETAPPKPQHTRRRRLRGWGLKLVTTLVSFALFVGGIAFGMNVYNRVQPPPPLVGDPSTGGVATPAVVKELAGALASNDSDSLRSAVPQGPYEALTAEIQSWQIQGVNSVETLATMQDGPRSATEIVIIGKSTNGDPVAINLVVQVDDNQIVSFR